MKHSIVDKSHIPVISKSDRDLLQYFHMVFVNHID